MLATLLDEILARTAIVNFPAKVGVTASLTVNYRAPTRADQFIVTKTKLQELKGRKSVVIGRIEDLDGNLLVDASALFVEPKYAKLLNPTKIEQMLGKKVDEPPKPAKVPQEAAV
jgi:acyl-coenzyme A thioesterase PaaI-like protein